MAYSRLQLARIRAALDSFRRYGSGQFGKRLSWRQVVGKIEEYTAYSGHTGHEEGPDDEDKRLKNYAEALRQFVTGRSADSGKGYRQISEELLRFAIEFLSHPEIALLSRTDQSEAEIDLTLAIKLRQFLCTRNKARQIEESLKYLKSHFAGLRYTDEKTLRAAFGRDAIFERCSAMSHCLTSFSDVGENCIREAEYSLSSPAPALGDSKGEERSLITETFTGIAVFASPSISYIFLRDTMSTATTGLAFKLDGGYRSSGRQRAVLSDQSSLSELNMGDDAFFTPIDTQEIDFAHAHDSLIVSGLRQRFIAELTEGIGILEEMAYDPGLLSHDLKSNIIAVIAQTDLSRLVSARYILKLTRDYMSESEGQEYVEELSETLLGALKRRATSEFEPLLAQGARLDRIDRETGLNGLHMLAHLGWRDGLMLALSNPEKCDFAARDRDGKLASHHALVYGNDLALSRLLGTYEQKAGVGLRPQDDRPLQAPITPSGP